MGAVARVNSAEANEPFSTFVLAGAHDAGMNVMDGIVLVTSDAAFPALIAGLSVLLPIPGSIFVCPVEGDGYYDGPGDDAEGFFLEHVGQRREVGGQK